MMIATRSTRIAVLASATFLALAGPAAGATQDPADAPGSTTGSLSSQPTLEVTALGADLDGTYWDAISTWRPGDPLPARVALSGAKGDVFADLVDGELFGSTAVSVGGSDLVSVGAAIDDTITLSSAATVTIAGSLDGRVTANHADSTDVRAVVEYKVEALNDLCPGNPDDGQDVCARHANSYTTRDGTEDASETFTVPIELPAGESRLRVRLAVESSGLSFGPSASASAHGLLTFHVDVPSGVVASSGSGLLPLVGGSGPNTAAGTNVAVSPLDPTTGTRPVDITFAGVTHAGETTVTTSSIGPAAPAGFALGDPPRYFEIATTATFTGSVEICISYGGLTLTGAARLLHYEAGTWSDVTTSDDPDNQLVCGSVTSLSPFVVASSSGASTDTTAPVLTLPAGITTSATGPTGTTVAYLASATDDVDASPIVACTPPSGSLFPLGTTIVTCTATDASGNQTTGTFAVGIVDTNGPVLSLPPDQAAEATQPGGAAVVYAASATDDVDPSPSVSCAPASGSFFHLGTTVVGCTATDASGNESTASFIVDVVDTTAPQLTVPAGVSALATDSTGATVLFAPVVTATDVVDQSPVVECAPDSGSLFPIGMTVVTCTATDDAGNASSGTFTVVVSGAAETPTGTDVTVSPIDEATGTTPVQITFDQVTAVGATSVTVSNNGPATPAGFSLGEPPRFFEIATTASFTGSIEICISYQGLSVSQPAHLLHFEGGAWIDVTTSNSQVAEVVCGSVTSLSPFGVASVVDVTGPTLTIPADLTVNATGPTGATVAFEAVAVDDTDPSPAVVCTPTSGSPFPLGTTVVSCTATDAAGNQATGTFSVRVLGAAEQIVVLIDMVKSFNLKQGISNSLDVKLSNARQALDKAKAGEKASACNLIDAFINEVKAQEGGELTTDQAAKLRVAADGIKAALGCS